jgi:hypothetical protein
VGVGRVRVLVNGSRRRILSLYAAAALLWVVGAVVAQVVTP